MISEATYAFWDRYNRLPIHVKEQVRAAYRLWQPGHYHPSLHFKQTGKQTVSIRIGRCYCAVGVQKSELIVWIWIGSHEEYNHYL